MAKKFRGPAQPLTRSKYGQKVSAVRARKFSRLRSDELEAPRGFKNAISESRKKKGPF